MTLPPELTPLAQWAFPLLLLAVMRYMIYLANVIEKKLDIVLMRKVECVTEFASKEDVKELAAEVRKLSSALASVKALAHAPDCRS